MGDSILFLWILSFFVSIVCLVVGLFRRSWLLMLVSSITFLPVGYYFSGAVNYFKLIGLIPIVLFVIAVLFWYLGRRSKGRKK